MPGIQEEAADKIDEVLTMVDVKNALMGAKTERANK
jgi:hypothetical protein